MPGEADAGRDHTGAATSRFEPPAVGPAAMGALVDAVGAGIVVVDEGLRCVYANPAACRLLGRSLDELSGRDFLDSFPTREHLGIKAGFALDAAGQGGFSAALLSTDDVLREVVCSTYGIDLDGRAHGVAVVWDLTTPRRTARTALALAQSAAQLVGAGDLDDILTSLARHAVEGSSALSCGITVIAEDHSLAAAGAYGPAGPTYGHANPAWATLADTPVERAVEAMTVGTIAFADPPGRPTVVPDARTSWEADPITRPFAANLVGLDWRGGVYVPLSWEHTVIGFLAVFLPSQVAEPTEPDLALYRALADQAAVVVMNGRFAERAGTTAALLERSRLARELHDSVSQGLFSMTMHARAAQLSLTGAGFTPADPLARLLTQLTDLTRGALAEMRALVFELRPDALSEAGLIGALQRMATMLAERGGPEFTVVGPQDDLDLDPDAEEHLYRITVEAMNNTAKHAGAVRASVRVTTSPERLTVTIADDGAGFDPSASFPGHLGLSTMAQRAGRIGAEHVVTSAPGCGTTVDITLGRRGPRTA